MASVNLHPYESVFPISKVGVMVQIEFSHIEAQTIKNTPGLAEISGFLAGLSFGPLAGSLVPGFVYAARQEIGEKDEGNGVDFVIDQRLIPFPSTSITVASR